MTSQSDAVIGFDRETYQQAFSEIESLAGRLPKLAVANLAREVVTQLAARLPQFATGDHVPSAEEIDRICFALMEADHTAAARMIEHIRAEGATLERIYLSYLSAAAKRLGEMWASDQASFLEVTIGSARIYAILNTMRVAIARPVKLQRRSAVFALVPGEDHSLGVRMAADLLRDRGWDIDLHMGLSHDMLVEVLRGNETRLIGLSAGGSRTLVPLMRLIVALRISNPHARIIVGGQIVNEGVDMVGVVGADASAPDFESTLAEMERLIDLPRAAQN